MTTASRDGGARAGDDTVVVPFSTEKTKTAGAIASTLRYGPEVRVSSSNHSSDTDARCAWTADGLVEALEAAGDSWWRCSGIRGHRRR